MESFNDLHDCSESFNAIEDSEGVVSKDLTVACMILHACKGLCDALNR